MALGKYGTLIGNWRESSRLILFLANAAAAVAGAAAATAFVDAKFHISKDIGTFRYLLGGEREFKKNGPSNYPTWPTSRS